MCTDEEGAQAGVEIERGISFSYAGLLWRRIRGVRGLLREFRGDEARGRVDQGAEPDDASDEAGKYERRALVGCLLRNIIEGPVSFAVGAGDHEGGSQGGEEIVAVALDAETVQL